jgi:hypothetical protein
MTCYDCHPEATPAVAICRLCGKGICREHCIRQNRPVYEHVPSGMAAQVRDTGRRAPRLLCKECAQAVGAGDRGATIDVHR